MSPWHELRKTSAITRVLLAVVFVLFNVFAVLRALPVNSQLPENREADRGVYNRNVYRVFKLANRQAALPFSQVKNHAIFFDRNPGLFMFVAELFVRAGARTPFPNQLLAIGLWDAGLLALFLWLLRLFKSELVALASVCFVLSTPFVLFYSSSIHHEPWCFFFFNLTFYYYVRYLTEGRPRRWLIATYIAYFLLCQNYWFYYMSAGILFVALQLRQQQFSLRDTLILATVPVLAGLTTFLQMVYALDGVDHAWFRLKDIAAARTLDMRIENSKWFPDKTFVTPEDLHRYPTTMLTRIQLISGYSVGTFASMLFASVVFAGRLAWQRLHWLLLVLVAGGSWFAVMIQHTVIHRFAGMYSWFAWVLIVATFLSELARVMEPRRTRVLVAAFALPLSLFVLQREYLPHLETYLQNARGQSAGPPPPRPKKNRTATSADTLSTEDMKE